ncbi:unnamed protein product [Discosporangium mesarthrocarpum]
MQREDAKAPGVNHRLQSAKISGFRSFSEETTVAFGHSGLTSITGPNGAGKSTLLNALSFGLGFPATQLGARQVSFRLQWKNM